MITRTSIAAGLFVIAFVGAHQAGAAPTSGTAGITETEIVVGQPAAFSGPSAGLGVEMWRGVSAAFQEANDNGGIHGRKVRLVVADDGYDAERAGPAVKKLIEEEQVFALGFGVGTPTITKALPVVQQYYDKQGLFYFANFTGAQMQRTPPFNTFVFNVRASYAEEITAIVDAFVAAGYRKIGMFLQNDAFGTDGRTAVMHALKKHSLTPAGETTYPRGQTLNISNSNQVKALRDAGADAVVMIGAYQACAGFIRDARVAKWDVPIHTVSFGGATLIDDELRSEEARLGTKLRDRVIVTQVVPSPDQTSIPLVARYRAAIDKYASALSAGIEGAGYKPTSPYSFVSLEGYLSARAFLAALEKAGRNVTHRSLYAAIEGLGRFDLGLGEPLEFSATRHQALDKVWFTHLTPEGVRQVNDPLEGLNVG